MNRKQAISTMEKVVATKLGTKKMKNGSILYIIKGECSFVFNDEKFDIGLISSVFALFAKIPSTCVISGALTAKTTKVLHEVLGIAQINLHGLTPSSKIFSMFKPSFQKNLMYYIEDLTQAEQELAGNL